MPLKIWRMVMFLHFYVAVTTVTSSGPFAITNKENEAANTKHSLVVRNPREILIQPFENEEEIFQGLKPFGNVYTILGSDSKTMRPILNNPYPGIKLMGDNSEHLLYGPQVLEVLLQDFPYYKENMKYNFNNLKKKSQTSYEENLDSTEKNIPYRFLGLRGKKSPSGFLGMRGKKVPAGFMGMRGKKAPSEFLGMRGKKDPSEFLGIRGKMAPSEFLGMRGKKAPSEFLGMRGKKAPSEFLGMRGKKTPSGFMGMRGKKAPSEFLGMRGKKTPSGFMGMRGKKTPTELLMEIQEENPESSHYNTEHLTSTMK